MFLLDMNLIFYHFVAQHLYNKYHSHNVQRLLEKRRDIYKLNVHSCTFISPALT